VPCRGHSHRLATEVSRQLVRDCGTICRSRSDSKHLLLSNFISDYLRRFRLRRIVTCLFNCSTGSKQPYSLAVPVYSQGSQDGCSSRFSKIMCEKKANKAKNSLASLLRYRSTGSVCEAKTHQIYFRPGLRPEPQGSLRRSPNPLVGWRGGCSFPMFRTPVDACGISLSTGPQY